MLTIERETSIGRKMVMLLGVKRPYAVEVEGNLEDAEFLKKGPTRVPNKIIGSDGKRYRICNDAVYRRY